MTSPLKTELETDLGDGLEELRKFGQSLDFIDGMAQGAEHELASLGSVVDDLIDTFGQSNRVYEETGQLLRDVRKRGDEYGFSAQQQAASLQAIAAATTSSNLPLAKRARVMEELIIETQSAAEADRLYADALKLVERNGGRVEDEVRKLTEAAKGQASAFNELHPSARALAAGYENIRDRQLRAKLMQRAYLEESQRVPDALDRVNDRLTIGAAQASAFVARLGPAGVILGVVGTAAIGAAAGIYKLAEGAVAAYIERSPDAKARSDALSTAWGDLEAQAGQTIYEITGLGTATEVATRILQSGVGNVQAFNRELQMGGELSRRFDLSLNDLKAITGGPLGDALFGSASKARALADAFAAASAEAARLRREEAALAKARSDFSEIDAGVAEIAAIPGRPVAEQRAAKKQEQLGRELNFQEMYEVGLTDSPDSFTFAESDVEAVGGRRGGGGGGGGRKKDQFAEIQRAIKQAVQANAELRDFERSLATATIDELDGALEMQRDRYALLSDEIEQYGYAIDQVTDKKAKAKVEAHVAALERQATSTEKAIERLEGAQRRILGESAQNAADVLGEGLPEIEAKIWEWQEKVSLALEEGRQRMLGELGEMGEGVGGGFMDFDSALEFGEEIQKKMAEAASYGIDPATARLQVLQEAARQAGREMGEVGLAAVESFAMAAAAGEDSASSISEAMGSAVSDIIPMLFALAQTYLAAQSLNPFALFAATLVLRALAGAAQGAFSGGSRGGRGTSGGARPSDTRRQLENDGKGDTIIVVEARFGSKQIQPEVEAMVNEGSQRGRVQVESTGRRRRG